MNALNSRLKTKQRVLIADYDTHFARRLCDDMRNNGYESRIVYTVAEAKAAIQSWQPQSVFVNLMLPEGNAISLMRFVGSPSIRHKPTVTVMAKQTFPVALDEARKAGAQYTLLKPFSLEDALAIVELGNANFQHKHKRPMESNSVKELHLLNLILRQATMGSTEVRMFNLLRMINMKVDGLRSSLIQWISSDCGVVLASNDDQEAAGLRLNLKEYPEIAAVRSTGRPMIIPNVRVSDILAPVQAKLAKTPFETIVLFPVRKPDGFFAVLSLRMEQKDPQDMFYIEKFGEVCAQIIALTLADPQRAVRLAA